MTRTPLIAVGLGFVMAVVGPQSFAQQPGGGGGAVMPASENPILVLSAPAVQEELKLTPEQRNQVFELGRDAQRKFQATSQQVGLNGGNGQDVMVAFARLRQDNLRAASAILNAEQKARVEQIMLQIEGPVAVARPDVAEKLNLTRAQNQKVQSLMAQLQIMRMQMTRYQMMQIQQAQGGAGGLVLPGQAAPSHREIVQLRNSAAQAIGKVLDAKQKFNLKKLYGETFDLTKIDPDLTRPPELDMSDPPLSKAAKAKAKRKAAAAAAKDAPAKDAETDEKPK